MAVLFCVFTSSFYLHAYLFYIFLILAYIYTVFYDLLFNVLKHILFSYYVHEIFELPYNNI